MTDTRVEVELDPGLDAPATARALVAAHAEGLDPHVVADAVLCVSEVVSNAVLYGRPVITLTLETRAGGLAVEVTDHGGPLDVTRLREPDEDSTGGRGLQIVATLARTWGVRTGEDAAHRPNKTVWFELVPHPVAALPTGARTVAVAGGAA